MLTDHLPRVSLAQLPTPVEEMPRLRSALGGGPRLLVKRDDQTGLATGGNKTRKLEFVLGDVLQTGADTLITTAGVQSNHCRQTAAAAAKLGLRCILVLRADPLPRDQWNGNLLLDDLLGAEIRWAGKGPLDGMGDVLESIADEVRAEGGKPYIVPLGASVPVGAAGYAAAVEELHEQLGAMSEQINRIVFLTGSGGTHAGLLVGVKALGLNVQVEGIMNFAVAGLREKVMALASDTAKHLGREIPFSDADFVLLDAAGTHGYGVITDSERDAMRLLARTEAIIADPIYTGRALAGLVNRIKQGVYRDEETILFWHTGGIAGLYPRAADVLGLPPQ